MEKIIKDLKNKDALTKALIWELMELTGRFETIEMNTENLRLLRNTQCVISQFKDNMWGAEK